MGKLQPIHRLARILAGAQAEDRDRLLGWFLFTVGWFGFTTDYFSLAIINLPYALLTSMGVWFIIRSLHLFEEGDTARILKSAHVPRPLPTRTLAQYLFMGLSVVFFAAALTVLYTLSIGWFVGMLGFLALTLVYAGWYLQRSFTVLLGALAGVASLVNGMYLLQPAEEWSEARLISTYTAGLLLLGVYAVAALQKRSYKDQRPLMVSLLLTGTTYVAAVVVFSELSFSASWQIALLSYALGSLAFALVSWVRSQRYSYTKYFLIAAAGAAALYCYLFVSGVTVVVLWLLLAVVSLFIGYFLPSYSSRIVGLLSMAGATANYYLLVFPNPIPMSGSLFLQERVWLGLLLSALLGLLAWAYQGFPLRMSERVLEPMVRNGGAFMAYLTLVLLVLMEAQGSVLSLMLIFFGIVGYVKGTVLHNELIRGLAPVVTGAAFLQFILTDVPQFSDSLRLVVFLILGLLVLTLAILVTKSNRLVVTNRR